jgi:hypothetical protein
MIGYLYFAFFIIALIADFLPFSPIIKTVSSLAINSVQTIKSKNINDSEKEKILLFNSFEIFKHSIKLIGFILLILIFGGVLLLISTLFKSLDQSVLFHYVLTINGLLLSVISFLSYFLLKKLYVRFRI